MWVRPTAAVALAVGTAIGLGVGPPVSAAPQPVLTVVATVPVGAGPMTPLLDEAAGRVFVPNAYAGTVTAIDTASRAVVATVPVASVEGEEFRGAVLDSARSRLFVLTDSNRVVTVDTRSSAVVRRATVPDEAQDLVLDPQRGRVYVLSSMPSRLTTLASPSGRIVRTTAAPRGAHLLAVNPWSGRLFIDDREGQVGSLVVVEPRTGARVWSLRPVGGIAGIVVDPSGRRAYVPLSTEGSPGTVLVVDTLARRILARLAVGEYPDPPVLDPVRRTAYVSSWTGTVTVVDTASVTVADQFAVTGWPKPPALDAAHARLFLPVDSPTGGMVAVYDTGSNQLLTSLSLPRRPGTPAVDSTGAWLYVTSGDVASGAAPTLSIVSTGT